MAAQLRIDSNKAYHFAMNSAVARQTPRESRRGISSINEAACGHSESTLNITQFRAIEI
jgi:hypothetical protein